MPCKQVHYHNFLFSIVEALLLGLKVTVYLEAVLMKVGVSNSFLSDVIPHKFFDVDLL